MATITGFNEVDRDNNADFYCVTSNEASPTDTVEFEIKGSLPHCFVGIECLDEWGKTDFGPHTGRILIEVREKTNPGVFSELQGGAIDLANKMSRNFSGNVDLIRATVVTPLTGVTSWRVIFTANRS